MAEFKLFTDIPQQVLEETLKQFGTGQVALASSFGAEDQVLTAMLAGVDRKARIFTLDTGRQFQETYDTQQHSVDRYGITYEVYAPEAADVAELVAKRGPNLFYNSIADRKRCCEIRKIRPLRKALSTVKAWICGLRREQAVTRQSVELVAWDDDHGIYKICPLFDWTEAQVWQYIREHNVPYNGLHDRGFPSIGCAPCTRAVQPGEDVRAGRWWWEAPEHKECGLHRSRLKQSAGQSATQNATQDTDQG